MVPTYRPLLRLRIIGYFNIFFIFLGLTRVRIDFIAQRVVCSRLVACYVICANIASLVYVPLSYIYNTFDFSFDSDNILDTFSDRVNVIINFVAVAFSVLLRAQRERIHLEIAETIIALDRNCFSRMCSDKPAETRADHLLCFKLFALSLQTFVPLCDSLIDIDEPDVHAVLHSFFYTYMQNILAASHFMYFYMLWLLRSRFSALNIKMKELGQQLQQMLIMAELGVMNTLAQQQLIAIATKNLLQISQIHARLSRLLVRLNENYKPQIFAVLMANLVESISFGYYLTLAINGTVEWELDFEAILFCSYAAILFVDINLLYWISDMTMHSHGKMAQILRRFQILPPLGNEFEQQCELFALQLQQRIDSAKIAGMFQLNRQSALGLWSFAFAHIIVLLQFDLESHLNASTENQLLNRFNKFFRIEEK